MLNLDHNKKYLLACSYGPDSMALFDMLYKEGFSFEVAHVNYHLREESISETKGLLTYASSLGIKVHVKEVKEWNNKSNLEAKCRLIRYDFFSDLVKEHGFDAVLVAHNQDDLIETYIIQQKRGGLVEFYGLNEKSIYKAANIYRPLLSFKKSDLLKYCDKNHVPYSIDSSNLENKFLRNRIRHQVVEHLSDSDRESYIQNIDLSNKELIAARNKVNQIKVDDIGNLNKLNELEFKLACFKLLKRSGTRRNLSNMFIKEVKKVINSDKPNIIVELSKNLNLIKEYDRVYFGNLSSSNYSYFYSSRVEDDNEHFYINLLGDTSNLHISDDDFPIQIRTAKSNDSYEIKNYSVSLRRLFIDWKMPMSFRKKWPVILNKNNRVIYVPRYSKHFVVNSSLNFYVK